MSRLALLLIATIFPLLPSCMGVYMKENTYKATSESSSINGADVRIALKPMGGATYGSLSAMVVGIGAGKTDGPFIWRVEAEGEEGVHEKLWVNRVTVTTSNTDRSEPLPKEHLDFHSEFKPMKGKDNAGKTFANHQFPGKLEVYPNTDGDITIKANVSVQSNSGVKSDTITFSLIPDSSNGFDSIFIPTEIMNSFGGKDPTEWNW